MVPKAREALAVAVANDVDEEGDVSSVALNEVLAERDREIADLRQRLEALTAAAEQRDRLQSWIDDLENDLSAAQEELARCRAKEAMAPSGSGEEERDRVLRARFEALAREVQELRAVRENLEERLATLANELEETRNARDRMARAIEALQEEARQDRVPQARLDAERRRRDSTEAGR